MRALTTAFCLALLVACSAEVEEEKLVGARRPDLPVFEPSVVEKTDTFHYGTGDGLAEELTMFDGVSWTLSTHRPMAEVIVFYEKLAEIEVEAAAAAEDDGEESWGGGGWGDEEADEEGVAAEPHAEDGLADLPSRTFRLASRDKDNVEITVYLQARQRRIWFTIAESVPAAAN